MQQATPALCLEVKLTRDWWREERMRRGREGEPPWVLAAAVDESERGGGADGQQAALQPRCRSVCV